MPETEKEAPDGIEERSETDYDGEDNICNRK